jgi:adenosylmethionine-8-amino-7-oxononanoate aminotransferase
MAVELVADRHTKRAFPAADRVGMQVCTAARKHGVFIRPLGDVLVLMPALTLSAAERETLVRATAAALADVLGPPSAPADILSAAKAQA